MMRTTVDLPDDIHTLASELAHQQQKTMSEVLTEFIRQGISSEAVPEIARSGWPIISVGRPVTAEDVRSLEDE